jgi:hypothetical protein
LFFFYVIKENIFRKLDFRGKIKELETGAGQFNKLEIKKKNRKFCSFPEENLT